MKRFPLALASALAFVGALLISSVSALAQNCSGQPSANTVCAGPSSGGAGFPGFRAIVPADIASSLPAGVPTNALGNGGNPVVANYSIATTDCGTTLQLGTGSTGFFTLTLPTVSGLFPSTCVVTFHNNDTTRGKLLSGFPSDLTVGTNVLWPNQVATVGIINGAWQTLNPAGIYFASAGVTLNVDHVNGSTSNVDCLAASGAGACKTIYQAYQLLQGSVRVPSAATVNIQSDCGFTETPPQAFLGSAFSSTGVVFIRGNEVTPSSCSFTTAGAVVDDGAVISMRGFKVICSGSISAWTVAKGGILVSANTEWGACAGGQHIAVFQGGTYVNDGGTETVSGNFTYHIYNPNGYVQVNLTGISVPNALTFTAWYYGGAPSFGDFSSSTYSGTGSGAGSTGAKYSLVGGALLLGGATLPGATAGSNTGGFVDGVGAGPLTVAIGTNVGISTSGCAPAALGGTCTLGATTDNVRHATLALGTTLTAGSALTATSTLTDLNQGKTIDFTPAINFTTGANNTTFGMSVDTTTTTSGSTGASSIVAFYQNRIAVSGSAAMGTVLGFRTRIAYAGASPTGSITVAAESEIASPSVALISGSPALTITNHYGQIIRDQIVSLAGVTQTNPSEAIHIDSQTGSGAFAINQAGLGIVQFATVNVKMTGITTGTNADFLCLSATGVVLIQASACTISSLRFKPDWAPYRGDALATLERLDVGTFHLSGENRDRNARNLQVGLSAESVARAEPLAAIYEDDGATPKSYRQEGIIALLVAGMKELNAKLEARR